MGKMFVLDKTGHSTHEWDPGIPAEVEVAKSTFDTLTGKGYKAFRMGEDGQKGIRMNRFEPESARMMFVPQLAGG